MFENIFEVTRKGRLLMINHQQHYVNGLSLLSSKKNADKLYGKYLPVVGEDGNSKPYKCMHPATSFLAASTF